jgi:hypothetical protein
VRECLFAPSPLIERAAMTPRIYLAGFEVFCSDAFRHDGAISPMSLVSA